MNKGFVGLLVMLLLAASCFVLDAGIESTDFEYEAIVVDSYTVSPLVDANYNAVYVVLDTLDFGSVVVSTDKVTSMNLQEHIGEDVSVRYTVSTVYGLFPRYTGYAIYAPWDNKELTHVAFYKLSEGVK